jgi:hypothetical protein
MIDGAQSDLNWTSAKIYRKGKTKGQDFLDIQFTAKEGDFHWVIFEDLVGAYQYFVNHALPTLGEFRTLWRLDNTSFPNGRTNIKDGALPTLAEIASGTKVQDETWQLADGSYITKYDWTAWIRDQDYYGVYGDEFGSWYINPGKDYYNGNHLKQELMVHRESSTGDAVQLNMIHGTHFMVSSNDVFPDGKVWGPWLWYLVLFCHRFYQMCADTANRTTDPKRTPPPAQLTSSRHGPTNGSRMKPTSLVAPFLAAWFSPTADQLPAHRSSWVTIARTRRRWTWARPTTIPARPTTRAGSPLRTCAPATTGCKHGRTAASWPTWPHPSCRTT